MGTLGKKLIDDVFAAVRVQLTAAGMRKRSGQIYTFEVSKEALGLVGLSRVFRRTERVLSVNPTIGIRYQPLEKLLAEACGEKLHSYFPPTISQQIGYLMPQAEYVTWDFTFDSDIEKGVEEMVRAIKDCGFSFMKKYADFEALQGAILNREYGFNDVLDYRIPIVYLMQGSQEQAASFVDGRVKQMASRDDEAAEAYRGFAAGLKQMMIASDGVASQASY